MIDAPKTTIENGRSFLFIPLGSKGIGRGPIIAGNGVQGVFRESGERLDNTGNVARIVKEDEHAFQGIFLSLILAHLRASRKDFRANLIAPVLFFRLSIAKPISASVLAWLNFKMPPSAGRESSATIASASSIARSRRSCILKESTRRRDSDLRSKESVLARIACRASSKAASISFGKRLGDRLGKREQRRSLTLDVFGIGLKRTGDGPCLLDQTALGEQPELLIQIELSETGISKTIIQAFISIERFPRLLGPLKFELDPNNLNIATFEQAKKSGVVYLLGRFEGLAENFAHLGLRADVVERVREHHAVVAWSRRSFENLVGLARLQVRRAPREARPTY